MLRGVKRTSVAAVMMGILLSAAAFAQEFVGARYQEEKKKSNESTVSIIVSSLPCTCARFAEDIRNVVNDMRPGGIRVFPILSVGGVQNIKDILFLRGIDFGIVQQDNIHVLKATDPALYANLENRVQYITKLYNAEVHIIARPEINSLADLEGKAVNFHLADSPAATTAENIFKTLKINVQKSYLDHPAAFEKLSKGELSAVFVMTGAPQPSVRALKAESGLHFLPIDEDSLPGYNVKPLLAEYLPSELTHELYPNLVEEGKPVPTIANRTVLAVYNWPENTERYARAARFVNEFFSKIEKFHDPARHPKWAEVNLAAEIPGWVRFKPAKEWLAGRRAITAQTGSINGGNAEQAFESFLLNYAASTGKAISPQDRDALLAEFKQFLDKKTRSTTR